MGIYAYTTKTVDTTKTSGMYEGDQLAESYVLVNEKGEIVTDEHLPVTPDGEGGFVNNDPMPEPNTVPDAAFTATPTDLLVNVDASASTDAEGTLTYAWDFGDSTTGTGVTASHTYASAATYTITLTVTDEGSLTDTASEDVTVTAGV